MENVDFNEILKQYRTGHISWKKMCLRYGLPENDNEILRIRFKNWRKKNKILANNQLNNGDDTDNYKKTVVIKPDGSQESDRLILMSEEDSRSREKLMELHNFDSSWQMVSARNSLWHTQRKGGGRELNYSSKIVVKPRDIPEWNLENIKKIFEELGKRDLSLVKNNSYNYIENGKALVISIADLHLGLLATKIVCDNEYNLQIAEDVFLDAIKKIKERVKGREFEEVMFVAGNDFLNTDNLSNTTTGSTPQDSSSFWFEMMIKGIELLTIAINSFLEIAPVKIYYVPSNHDIHSTFSIMLAVKAVFENNKDVVIDTSPLPRKYYKFGRNVFGLAHDLKKAVGLEIFTTEAQKYWSDGNHFYFLLAHLHKAMIYENKGKLEIFRSPTISGYSRWSGGKGFISNEKRTQAFIVDKDNGIEDILNIIV